MAPRGLTAVPCGSIPGTGGGTQLILPAMGHQEGWEGWGAWVID